MTNDLARAARDVVRGLDRAALASLLPANATLGAAAWPYASLVLVAVDHDLSALLLLSDLAEHSKAIAADPRVSLLFDATQGLDQPLTGPRVTLVGRARRTDELRLHRRFLARHPDAEMYAGFKDFAFYRVAVEHAHLVAGFGKIRWLERDELLGETRADDLPAAEPGIVAHMNQDHADAVQLYAARLLGRPGEGWRMTGIDPEGIDLRCGGQVARLVFDAPLTAAAQARAALVDLVKRARAASSIPPP